LEGLALRVDAGEGREQRRVDVQDAVGEASDESGRQDAHEAGEDHRLDGVLGEDAEERVLEGLAPREELVVDGERGLPRRLRARQRPGARPVRHHAGDLGGGERAARLRVEERLEVGPGSGDEDAESHCCAANSTSPAERATTSPTTKAWSPAAFTAA